MRSLTFLYFGLPWLSFVAAASGYSIYQPKQQVIFGGNALTLTAASTAAPPNATTGASYDQTVLNPPPVPNPAIPTQFQIQLSSSGGLPNPSVPQIGGFAGLSIEMSVANQVLGRNSTLINVPLLNLLQNLVDRAGAVFVRVGGNSQEEAELVPSLPNGTMIAKDTSHSTGPTSTPPLEFTIDLLYAMGNISKFTNTCWYIGIPFLNSTDKPLGIVENAQAILGQHLCGAQAGNEPDLYINHQRRPSTYSPSDYFGEVGALIQQIANNPAIPNKNNLLIVPSVQQVWAPDLLWQTGKVQEYSGSIGALAVERYPDDNCAAIYPSLGTPKVPQDVFYKFLQHNLSTSLVQYYASSSQFALSNGKPLIMFETNTAACAGFPGISNSFGAALWGIDWALTLGYNNFTGALFHVGGQNALYNPMTPPPSGQVKYGRQWTIGPIYYSILAMAEILGPNNKSRISDVTQDINAPMYIISEDDKPTKAALINFVTDSTGKSTYNAVISLGGASIGQSNAVPPQVKVKYLLADSVSSKYNFTWAGQTLGGALESDGRLSGTVNVTTVQCDQNANTCTIPVPAPGFALVFFTEDALNAVTPSSTVTFPTTAVTTSSLIYIDPKLLATSNGHTGMKDVRGATSPGSASASSRNTALSSALTLFAAALGVAVVTRRW